MGGGAGDGEKASGVSSEIALHRENWDWDSMNEWSSLTFHRTQFFHVIPGESERAQV